MKGDNEHERLRLASASPPFAALPRFHFPYCVFPQLSIAFPHRISPLCIAFPLCSSDFPHFVLFFPNVHGIFPMVHCIKATLPRFYFPHRALQGWWMQCIASTTLGHRLSNPYSDSIFVNSIAFVIIFCFRTFSSLQ